MKVVQSKVVRGNCPKGGHRVPGPANIGLVAVLRLVLLCLALAGLTPGFGASPVVGDTLPPALPVAESRFAFIIDDGPLPQSTAKVLDALKAEGMRATFCLVGKNIAANPELAQRIAAEGHEIANQTWSHPELNGMPEEAIRREIERCQQEITRVTGQTPKFFRPPTGALDLYVQKLVEEMGFEVLSPSLDSGDWRNLPAGHVTRVILGGVTPGSSILIHDSFPRTVAEFPGLLEQLSKRGFKSLTVSELRSMAAGTGSMVATPR